MKKTVISILLGVSFVTCSVLFWINSDYYRMNKSQAECSEIISLPGITSQDIYSHALIAKDQRKNRLAFLLFREAAVRGHSDAQAELALIYQYNDFMPSDSSDWVEQLYWITKAAESGNPIYQYRLADMYHEVGRRGVREMLPLAQQWYKKRLYKNMPKRSACSLICIW